MKIQQKKSKWLVVGDCGKIYSIHKSKTAAQTALKIKEAWIAYANGWNRLTPEQQSIIQKERNL